MNNYTAPQLYRQYWKNNETGTISTVEFTLDRAKNGITGIDNHTLIGEVQSTGLFDKNNQEIFGGDIVLWNTSIPAQPYGDSPDPGEPRFSMCEVTYHCGRFGCDVKDGGFGDISLHQAFDEFGEPEVIGNVFENPELVEGEA